MKRYLLYLTKALVFLIFLLVVPIRGGEVFAEDCAVAKALDTATYTVTNSCQFSSGIDGVDSGVGNSNTGQLIIPNGKTLTILDGSSSPSTISVGELKVEEGGQIIIPKTPAGSQIIIGKPMWVIDVDGDGYAYSGSQCAGTQAECFVKFQAEFPSYTNLTNASQLIRKSTLTHLAVDCDDTNAAKATNCTVSVDIANGTLERLTNGGASGNSDMYITTTNPYGVLTSPVTDLGVNAPDSTTVSWVGSGVGTRTWSSGVITEGGETPKNMSELISQWNFNGVAGSGTTATNDISVTSCGGTTSNCDGTLTNFGAGNICVTSTIYEDLIGCETSGWTATNKRWGRGALMFDGVNDYVSVPDRDILDFSATTPMTIEVWARTTKSGVIQNLVRKDNYGMAGTRTFYLLDILADNTTIFAISDGTNSPIAYGTKITTDGAWHHYVGVVDRAADKLFLYIDGVLDGQTADTTTGTLANNAPLTFGAYYNNGSPPADQMFWGVMDSTRIYSRALSQAEIYSNYNAGVLEFQWRAGTTTTPDSTDYAAGTNWTQWAPVSGASYETQVDSMDTVSGKWQSDGTINSGAFIQPAGAPNTGTGADGDCTVDSTSHDNLSSESCSGRATADMVGFSSTALTKTGDTTITVSVTPTGLAVNDEILIINLQGTTTNYDSVGLYETKKITTINPDTKTLTADTPFRNTYDGTTQKIVVQRVPNYAAVTVNNGQTMTVNAWDGAKGGILFFRATGTVTVTGSISTNSLGYRGGVGGERYYGGNGGEAFCGIASVAGGKGGDYNTNGNAGACGGGGGGGCTNTTVYTGASGSSLYGGAGGGGGGGYHATGYGIGAGGGGGGYGTPGLGGGSQYSGTKGTSNASGTGGNGYYLANAPGVPYSYTGGGGGGGTVKSTEITLERLLFGSGAGGAGGSNAAYEGTYGKGGDGGAGGGILFIAADTITVSGSVTSNGGNGGVGTCVTIPGGGGGGAGGSIKLLGNTLTLGTSKVTATGGTGGSSGGIQGGNGGKGISATTYATALTGTTNPTTISKRAYAFVKTEGTAATSFTVGSTQPDANTVGLWHFDETSSGATDAKDSSGNGNDSTVITGTTVVNGFSGKARSFDGSNDVINVGSGATFDFGNNGPFTVSGWVKPTTLVDYAAFLSKTIAGRTATYTFMTTFMADGRLSAYSPPSGWVDTCGIGSVANGNWYHVAFVYDGTNITGYVNGVACTPKALSYSDSTAHEVTIGSWYSISTAYDYNGILDEIKLSNVVRTKDEISEEYRAGRDHRLSRALSSSDLTSTTKLPFWIASDRNGSFFEATVGNSAFANYEPDGNTVGLWHLEEAGPVATVIDSSGNSNNGTSTGTTVTVGKIGKGRSLNGSSYVNIPDNDVLDPASAITVDAWVQNVSAGDIVGKRHAPNIGGYLLYVTGSVPSFYVYSGGAWRSATSLIPLNTTGWNHVSGTFDGSTIKIYVNGVLGGTTIYSGTINNSTAAVRIGYSENTGNAVTGNIDEVRVSNVARTATEIRQAYEIGKRTHTITIDFRANLVAGALIADTSDTGFSVDETPYGSSAKANHLFVGDKIIVKENVAGTEYIAQGTVATVNSSTGAVTVTGWDTGSTAPAAGFTVAATVYKWQREWMDLTGVTIGTGTADSVNPKNAAARLTFRITNGTAGANIWLDDVRVGGPYITTSNTSVASAGKRYIQLRTLFTSSDTATSSSLRSVDVIAGNVEPSMTPTPTQPATIITLNSRTGRNCSTICTNSYGKTCSAVGINTAADSGQSYAANCTATAATCDTVVGTTSIGKCVNIEGPWVYCKCSN